MAVEAKVALPQSSATRSSRSSAISPSFVYDTALSTFDIFTGPRGTEASRKDTTTRRAPRHVTTIFCASEVVFELTEIWELPRMCTKTKPGSATNASRLQVFFSQRGETAVFWLLNPKPFSPQPFSLSRKNWQTLGQWARSSIGRGHAVMRDPEHPPIKRRVRGPNPRVPTSPCGGGRSSSGKSTSLVSWVPEFDAQRPPTLFVVRRDKRGTK